MFLFAQDSSFAVEIIRAASANGFWVFLSVCVFSGVVKHIAGEALKYRERVAMIENGMHPDSGKAVETYQTTDYHQRSA